MPIYTLEPAEGILHGCFSRELPPVLTIDPGDTVRYRTLDADWVTKFTVDLQHPPARVADLGERAIPQQPVRDEGHALSGPVAIRGAKAGMTLAVHVNRITVGGWGWSLPWYGTPVEHKYELPVILWQLDPVMMTGRNQFGHTVVLQPFMGVMGLALAEPGMHRTAPPRIVGGNLDCKALTAGSTLYLPIQVEGGLFSVGDGHAAQGDGESGGTAIECPMDLVELTFDLVSDAPLTTPYAETPSGWVTFGFDEDLNKAHEQALEAMIQLISVRYGVAPKVALALAGVVVDMHITQTVNGVRGVHAVLPYGSLHTASR